MAENQQLHHLKIIDLFKLSLRTFKIKPMRTFLTVLGMSIGIGTVLFLVSLGYGLQFILIGKLVTTEDSLITLEVSYPSESELTIKSQELKDILDLPEAEEVSPIAELPGEVKKDQASGLMLASLVKPNFFRLSGLKPDLGASFSENEPVTVISSQSLRLINLAVDKQTLNQKVNFDIFYEEEKKSSPLKESLTIKGIITDDVQPPFAIIPMEFLSQPLQDFKKVLVKAKSVEVVEQLRDKLLEKGYLISARIDLVRQARKITNIITAVLGVFGVTALVVAAVGMFNTMIVGLLERIYEVGIIKSLGATDKDVRNLFLMESSIMGFLGGTGGVILGFSSGKIINLGLSALARRYGGEPFDLFLTPFWFIVLILVLSIIIGLIAGFWPAYRASRLSPKEAFVRK